MKRTFKILALFISIVFIACAGGNSVKQKPQQSSTGMKATAKGIARYNKGCYQQALDYFFSAHEWFSALDQVSGVAMSLNNIGNVYRITGDRESAVLFFEKSFDIYADLNDHQGMVQVLSNKAAAQIDGEFFEAAARTLAAAEEIARQKHIFYIPLLSNRGVLLTKTKDYAQAEKVLKAALAETDPANASAFATVNFAMGKLMFDSQRYEKAVDYLETALTADRSAEFYKGIADDLAAIGSAYFNLRKNEIGVDFLERSIKVYALIGNVKKVETILSRLENISKTNGYDISVTLHFVNRWMEGDRLESLCK